MALYFIWPINQTLRGCSKQARELTESELIARAISINLNVHGHGSDRTRFYSSVADVIEQNPNCCRVEQGTSHANSLLELGAFDLVTVRVDYRTQEGSDDKYQSYVVLSRCGKYYERFGSPAE